MATGDMVSVGCKAPNGFVLNLDRYEITDKARGLVQRKDGGALVTLRGTAYKVGKEMPPVVRGGYAITEVPKDFWDAWIAQHRDFGPVVDGLIYCESTEDRAVDRSADQAEVAQMFAPLSDKDIKEMGVEEEEERAKSRKAA